MAGSAKLSEVRKQQKKFNSVNLILMSIGKSGNVKFEFQQLRFHSVRPNVHTIGEKEILNICTYVIVRRIYLTKDNWKKRVNVTLKRFRHKVCSCSLLRKAVRSLM